MSSAITPSTIARIAGNVLSGMNPLQSEGAGRIAKVREAVRLARAIAAEVLRTEPTEVPTLDPYDQKVAEAIYMASRQLVAERTRPLPESGSPAPDGGAVADVQPGRPKCMRCCNPATGRARYRAIYGETVQTLCNVHLSIIARWCSQSMRDFEVESLDE